MVDRRPPTRRPTLQQNLRTYTRALTERDDARKDLADAKVVVAELRARLTQYEKELRTAHGAKAQIADELTVTRTALAAQAEQNTTLRRELQKALDALTSYLHTTGDV